MRKFNKTLIAAAVTCFSAIPTAQAVDFGGYNTQKGKLDISGQRCDRFSNKSLDTSLVIDGGDEGDGPNTGEWFLNLFNFDSSVEGSGPLIAAQPDKKLSMDLTEIGFDNFEDEIAGYVDGDCDNGSFNFDTVIKKFETTLSKNGEKAKLRMQAEGTYFDFDKERDRKVTVKFNANMDAD